MRDKSFCPKCFAQLSSDNIAFYCQDRNKLHTDHGSRYFLSPRQIFDTDIPEQGICPVCKNISTTYVCPECREIVEEIENCLVIAITGPKASGKTVYISSLIKELLKQLPDKFGIETTISAESEPVWKHSYWLEENKTLPRATQKGLQKPLIFTLIKNKRKLNLLIYDASGEEFQKRTRIVENLKQLAKSDLIIDLIDALQIPFVSNHPSAIDYAKTHDQYETNERVLETIVDEIRETTLNKKKLTIPIAICISLTDVLNSIYNEQIPAFLRHSLHQKDRAFNLLNYQAIALSVRQQLILWKEGQLVKQVERAFKNVGYFGFSALGKNPNDTNTIVEYAPQNVIDPILWLLCKYGFIDTKK